MIFRDYARKYYESRLSVIPVNGKKPILDDWNDYCQELVSEEVFSHWELTYPKHGIGLCLGKASGLVAVDFDYDYEQDKQKILDILKGLLPVSPLVKCGKKGWTAFYKYNGEKNFYVNRNGQRLIDFLSNGKQTVIPPSIHPDTKKPYTWLTNFDLLNFSVDDLPSVPINFEDKIKLLAKTDMNEVDSVFSNRSGRHDVVCGYAWAILEDEPNIESLATKLIEYDLWKHKDAPYFTDKKYWNGKESMECALEVAEKCVLTVTRAKAKKNKTWKFGQPQATDENTAVTKQKKFSISYDDFKAFFNSVIADARRDIITGEFMHLNDKGVWTPVINQLDLLISLSVDVGLNKAWVGHHLARYESEQPYQWLIDIPEWDGVDHVKHFADHLYFSNVSKDTFVQLFKQWGAQIFKRVDDQTAQNNFVIFQGGQGIGKDILIHSMFNGFGPYFSNVVISNNEKTNYENMSYKLVLNISEFDRSSRMHVSSLKDMISSNGATFRAAYARRAQFVPFCCSFVLSCNVDDILRDDTGNRRFWIFNISKIDWTYKRDASLQLIAQFRSLAKSNFRAELEYENNMKLFIFNETPDKIDELLIPMVDEHIEAILRSPMKTTVEYKDMAPMILEWAKQFGVRQQMILSLIKKHNQKFMPGGIKRIYVNSISKKNG